MNKIFEDYSFGKYYVFDKNCCYVLVDEVYSDFVAVVDLNDEVSLSMYQMINAEPQRMSVTDKHIKDIIQKIDSKRNDDSSSFLMSKVQIIFLKDLTKVYTHLEFLTVNNEIYCRCFDLRELINEQSEHIVEFKLGRKSEQSFNKIINAKTFGKFCKPQDFLVYITRSGFLEFQSIENPVAYIFQEQLDN
tara:strand:+ start:591 stop:1160 length:570 start_codon:yes stop_codon:yes gene_type:complete